MKKAYTLGAKHYDLLYKWKDYKAESEKINTLVRKHCPKAKTLLEVACGTGNFLQYFEKRYECTGTDLSSEMLTDARKKLKTSTLKQANMITMDLHKQFDIVLCLFSSIGYVKTYANLRKTITSLSKHVKPGGLLIIEPWFTKEVYKIGKPSMQSYKDDNIVIARAVVAKARGNVSVMDMTYVIAERDKDGHTFVERHELGMFDHKILGDLIKKQGFILKAAPHLFDKERTLFVAKKSSY